MTLIIIILNVTGISYDTYNNGAQLISIFLTPATVCLAVPLYEKLKLLRDNLLAVMGGIIAGVAANLLTIWGVCVAFNLDETIFATMAPKSITTAIAMGISEEIGGNPTVTVGIVVFTGILGAIIVKTICKIFAITNPVSVGLACGNAAHAIGTTKALEIGEIEGAMSSLSIVIAGLLTVIIVPIMVTIFI